MGRAQGVRNSVQASKLCPACTPCCLQFATSVMVSGWYQDDKDDAETIWYTGEGLHMLVVVCKAGCFADGVRACTCLLWFARLGALMMACLHNAQHNACLHAYPISLVARGSCSPLSLLTIAPRPRRGRQRPAAQPPAGSRPAAEAGQQSAGRKHHGASDQVAVQTTACGSACAVSLVACCTFRGTKSYMPLLSSRSQLARSAALLTAAGPAGACDAQAVKLRLPLRRLLHL